MAATKPRTKAAPNGKHAAALPAPKPKVLAPKPRIVKIVVPRKATQKNGTKKSAQDRSVANDRAGRAGSNRTPSGSQETNR